ncbi:MAG: hypothetical protein MJZ75_06205 [Paludibacteraceae bacterium]|nr:hypothetical protein [Paludibacteraceae bacterium]
MCRNGENERLFATLYAHLGDGCRQRDRKGRAILCSALFPHCGDNSGALLGVRSVARLHSASSAD